MISEGSYLTHHTSNSSLLVRLPKKRLQCLYVIIL